MSLLANIFIKLPEWPIKNDIRYFLAFNKLIPNFISNLSPIKGYTLCYNLKPGDVVVDVGAFTGDYTIFAARKVGQTGKVIAFEPDKKSREILARNISHEKLDNVIISPKGLWHENTRLRFESNQGVKSTVFSDNAESYIDVASLDDELKKLGIKKIDVIKMDIEGSEIKAIEGAQQTLKQKPVLIIASYHIVDGKKTADYFEKYLPKLGYEVKSVFPTHLTTFAFPVST